MISQSTLDEYRKKANNTMMISALGEYTPKEFIELLDYIDELKLQIPKYSCTCRPIHDITCPLHST